MTPKPGRPVNNEPGRRPAPRPRLNRWATFNGFLDDTAASLVTKGGSAAAVFVWMVMFRHANGNTGIARGMTGVRLERLTRLTRKTVMIAVNQLVDSGLIESVPGEGTGTYKVNHSDDG